jgi:2-oxoglutarate ferredoxin oxidoreductase subunit beta
MQQGMTELRHKYLRHHKKFPHVWCPGCGNGIVLGSLIRAVEQLGLEKDDIVLATGIGCSGRMSTYVDFNTLHTTHGRALTFATGVKLAKPSLTVLTVMGDGDATAIGGNHFIHAARRNLDLTAIIINNQIYGMTGGQSSPTTPFVARGTVYHVNQLDKLLEKGIRRNGFSVVEIMSNCHVQFGRRNKMADPVTMLQWFKDCAVTTETASTMAPDSLHDKFTIGILADVKKPNYIEEYRKIQRKAQKR